MRQSKDKLTKIQHIHVNNVSGLQNNKVVLLEDLASHFGMRTQDAIDRLQNLLAEGSITGWCDTAIVIRTSTFVLPRHG